MLRLWSGDVQAGNDGRLHELPAWYGRVVLPEGQNLDVEQVMVLSLLKWRATGVG